VFSRSDCIGRSSTPTPAVEARAGRSVRQLFVEEGEPAFRKLETEVLVEALESESPAVIAAAGGVVLAQENREALRRACAKVVWLSADRHCSSRESRRRGTGRCSTRIPQGAAEMARRARRCTGRSRT
jgi:shikimate kinase